MGDLCPYCQNRIAAGSSVTVCPGCKTPHHAECWQDNGGCTIFGCRFAPGAVSPHPHSPLVDEELGIVLHMPAGSVPAFGQTTYQTAGMAPHAVQPLSMQGQESRNRAWLWGALAAAVLVLLIGLAIDMRRSSSPALEYLQRADQKIREGDFEGAKQECSQAISVDPDCIGAYYRKGLLLLGLGEENSTDRLSELVARAMRGETGDLDAADECFRLCVERGASSSNGNADGSGMTEDDIVARSNLGLALTALLRVMANHASQHPDYARQWADIARRYIRQARDCQLDYKGDRCAETIEDLLSDAGY